MYSLTRLRTASHEGAGTRLSPPPPIAASFMSSGASRRVLRHLISAYQARAAWGAEGTPAGAPAAPAAAATSSALFGGAHARRFAAHAARAEHMEPPASSSPAGTSATSTMQQQQQQQPAVHEAGAGSAAAPAPSIQQLQSPAPAAPGVKKTFYKRKLPCPPAIEFSSPEGRQVFKEALDAGTMTGFFKLIEQLSTQDEPAFCGLASLAMVLNALSIDPRRTWKGSWRWFHEKLLDCCLPLDKVAAEGVVLSQAACLAKCNGARVALHRAGTFSLEDFRSQLLDCAASGEEHIVVAYSRRTFLQTGDGHFSPIGGVHAEKDMALILDTARFKYPPHWVPIPMLYESMSAIDPATGQPRGFLRLAAEQKPDSVLFTLDLRSGGWKEAATYGHEGAPEIVESLARAGRAEPDTILQRLVAAAPWGSVGSFVAMRYATSLCAKDRCVPHAVRQQVLEELRATPLYQMVAPLVHSAAESVGRPAADGSDFAAEKLCMLLLLQPPSSWAPAEAWTDAAQHSQWQRLLETSAVSILESEAKFLRHQFEHIGEVLAGGGEHSVEDCGTCSPKHAEGHKHAPLATGACAPPAAAALGGGEAVDGPCGDGKHANAAHGHGQEGSGCCNH